jgi:hypothetical protein
MKTCAHFVTARVAILLLLTLLAVMATESSVSAANPMFLSAIGYRTSGAEVGFVTAADVNGDGFPDLLATNTLSSTIAVRLGNGDGTFRSPVTYYSGGGSPSTIVPVDIDGDGKIDLLVANQTSCYACSGDGTVAVLLNKGNGTFKPAVPYDAGGLGLSSIGPSKLAVVDVNGDGALDAVVVNCLPSGFALGSNGCGDGVGNGVVGVLLGNGNGTFQAVVTYDVGGAGGGGGGLAVADLNGDKKPDLVVSNACLSSGNCAYGSIGVLLNKGDGTFKPSVVYPTAGWGATGLALADVNGDGKLDALAGGCSTSDCWSPHGVVSVLLGTGDGAFGKPTALDSGGRLADGLAVADMNGDGKLDIVVANVIDNSVGLLLGSGNGAFASPQTFPTGGTLTYSVAVANLDGDTKPDVLASSCSYSPGCGATTGVVGALLSYGVLTKTTLNSSSSTVFVGQPVAFTAQVSTGIPNGELVGFYDGSSFLKSVVISNGLATFTTSALKAGTHSVEALYLGDATRKRSSMRITESISKYATTTTVSSSVNPSKAGQAVTFTAKVVGAGPQPSGKVVFLDGGISIGASILNAGVAKLTLSTLALGTHSITTQYAGDAANAKSTSSVLSQVIN